jgi:glutaryl-CoA dehydrogenase
MPRTDLFESPDYYLLDELLSDEHKLIRQSVRDWVKKELSPIIESHAQNATFPKQLLKGLAEIGAFGPTVPEEYGGAGLDCTGLIGYVPYICLRF